MIISAPTVRQRYSQGRGKSWKLRTGSDSWSDQVLLSKNFHLRSGLRQKSSPRKSGLGGGMRNLIITFSPNAMWKRPHHLFYWHVPELVPDSKKWYVSPQSVSFYGRNCCGVPSVQELLPIIILGIYLEIGNALPYRKNRFQELFGPVIVIKSVMEHLAGKVLFFVCAGKTWESPTPLRPAPPSNVGQSGIRARACSGPDCRSAQTSRAYSRDNFSGIVPVKTRSSELNRKQITVTIKIAAGNYLAIRNAKPYRINCGQN